MFRNMDEDNKEFLKDCLIVLLGILLLPLVLVMAGMALSK